jgi:DNA-binding Xre family transcriptional regulator
VEKVVAENLRRLMAHHQHKTPTAAARYVGISQQQMDRLLTGQKLRVDTLERVARGYGLEPYQLLIPGLEPGNPQVLRVLSAAELRLYKALEEARHDVGYKPGTQ